MNKRGSWGTKYGFYLAAIGSACGLGNLWRFPYVVGENGGGAFVLIYLFLAVVVGLPILVGELMLGRAYKQSILGVVAVIREKKKGPFLWIGRFAVLLSLVVLSYYTVISGWVLHFLSQFFVAFFYSDSFSPSIGFLVKNGWLQVGLASAHLLLAIVVVVKGLQDGLEKWIGYMMPLFAFLLIVLVFRSLSMPSAPDALRFLFYPDFSELKFSSIMNALGHVFFTLSVGFGTMVTFGSYLKSENHIPAAGFRVATMDSFISLLAGLLIFPIVLQASDIRLSDPYLLFESLPKFLLQMTGGKIFGFAFFLCLYTASLGASIGLLEVIVSNLIDHRKMRRRKAAWVAGLSALLLALIPALSSTVFRNVRFGEKGLIEILDIILINYILPIVGLGITYCIYKGLTEAQKEEQFIKNSNLESVAMFKPWLLAIKYIVPGLILLGLFLQLLKFI